MLDPIAYDPRDPSQDPYDAETWQPTRNTALIAAGYIIAYAALNSYRLADDFWQQIAANASYCDQRVMGATVRTANRGGHRMRRFFGLGLLALTLSGCGPGATLGERLMNDHTFGYPSGFTKAEYEAMIAREAAEEANETYEEWAARMAVHDADQAMRRAEGECAISPHGC